ncbi:MAG: hypothetical protein ABSA10_00145 [Anaerolineales bacterium]
MSVEIDEWTVSRGADNWAESHRHAGTFPNGTANHGTADGCTDSGTTG